MWLLGGRRSSSLEETHTFLVEEGRLDFGKAFEKRTKVSTKSEGFNSGDLKGTRKSRSRVPSPVWIHFDRKSYSESYKCSRLEKQTKELRSQGETLVVCACVHSKPGVCRFAVPLGVGFRELTLMLVDMYACFYSAYFFPRLGLTSFCCYSSSLSRCPLLITLRHFDFGFPNNPKG